MTLARATFATLLSFVVVGLMVLPLATAQRVSHASQRGPQLPGPFSLPASGAVGSGGIPKFGPLTPADLARQASPRNLNSAPGVASAVANPAIPVFLVAPTYSSGATLANSVAVGDLNGDGKLDMVVENQYLFSKRSNGSVDVLLGNGDGTFQQAVNYDSGGSTAMFAAVADVNGDGKLDILVANQCADINCYTGSVGVLLGNGDGTFQTAVGYASGGYNAQSVTVGDVNGDGKADLLVANLCTIGDCSNGSVAVLLGNGNGTFQAAVPYSSGGHVARSVSVGDVNGDGQQDLLVLNQCSDQFCFNGSVGVLLGVGDGTFQTPLAYDSSGVAPRSLVVADVNGDHSLDLLVANQCFSATDCTQGSVSVLLGNGEGSFQVAANYGSGGHQAFFVASGDVNGDGKADLLVANFCIGGSTCVTGSVSVLLGNGDGTFQSALNYSSGGMSTASVAIGDVNGDGKPDLLGANQCSDSNCLTGSVGVLLGNGDGSFQAARNYDPTAQLAFSVAVGDVNGDGKPDLVVASECADNTCTNGSVGVLLGNGDGTFQAGVGYSSGGYESASVAVGDVNGDGKLDLVVANLCVASSNCANGSVGVLLGNGDGTFLTAASYASGGQTALSVAVADLNGDGKPDLVVANQCLSFNDCADRLVNVLLGNGDGTFQTAVGYNTGGLYADSVAAGDVNGDGKPDLLVAHHCADSNCVNGSVGVLLGNGDGTFQSAVPYSSGGWIGFSATVGDVNGDGKPDLVVANECVSNIDCSAGSVSVLLGNGDGTFQSALSVLTPQLQCCIQSLVVADVDGDGKLDVASSIGNVLLLGNGDGTFQIPVSLGAGGNGIVAGDFNHDGKPELAVGGVTVLLNIAPNFHFYATTTAATSSLNPAPGGQSVTLTATVTPAFNAGALTGSVTFYDGTNPLGTASVNNGQAIVNTSSLSQGTHWITAAYVGDSNYVASTSAALIETITNGATTTAISSSLPASRFNQSVTFTATVTPQGSGTPTGTVTFTEGGNTLGASPLDGSGNATFTTSTLAIGSHTITATYSGDSNFTSSSASMTQIVAQASTTTDITSSLNPSIYNQQVTFTATITPQYGGQATGIVQFNFPFLGTQLSAPVVNNTATLQTDALALHSGTDNVIATYVGDGNFGTSISPTLTQTVNQATSTTAVTSSLNPSAFGQSVTLTGTVTPQFPGPNANIAGIMGFFDGTTLLGGFVNVVNGVGSMSVNTLSIGSHSITAVYSADTDILGSTSPVFSQAVNKATSTTSVVSSANPGVLNQPVTFTATVAGQFGGTPTGTVTFKNGGATLGTATLSAGQAVLNKAFTTQGTKSITAVYSGDSNLTTSTSAVLSEVIGKGATTTAVVSSQSPSAFGQSITFTATVSSSSGTPTGTVTFKNGAASLGTVTLTGATAQLTTSALTVGTKSITAKYNGDTNFSASTSFVLSQVVTAATTTTTVVGAPNPGALGGAITFTATVAPQYSGTPTGSVTFKFGKTKLGTVTLSGGTASVTTTTLPLGSDFITASYNGSTSFGKSSGSVTETVVQSFSTTTAVASSPNPSVIGNLISITATVTSTSGTPTGTVSFASGATDLGTATLSGGTATVMTSILPIGSDPITATYAGSGSFTGSSGSETQLVSDVLDFSNFSIQAVSQNTATLIWDTTVPSTSQACYVQFPGTVFTCTAEDVNLVTSHNLTITGLVNNGFYSTYVVSNAGSQSVTSFTINFRTLR